VFISFCFNLLLHTAWVPTARVPSPPFPDTQEGSVQTTETGLQKAVESVSTLLSNSHPFALRVDLRQVELGR
jgi:hypothetical protein